MAAMQQDPAVQEHVVSRLRRRARVRTLMSWGAISAGLPLTVIGPLIMTMLVWAIGLVTGHWLPWWLTFGIASLVLVPLLFWYAARGSEDMLLDAARSGSPRVSKTLWVMSGLSGSPLGWMTLGAVAASPRASAAGFQEIFLWGPRLIVRGIGDLLVGAKMRGVDVERAARLVIALRTQNRGLEVTALLEHGETPQDVGLELLWLACGDWIGVSEKADRVWLLTEAREALL